MKHHQNEPSPSIPPRLFLRFSDPPLESQFRTFYTSFYYRFAQASLGLGLLLVLGDFLVDYVAHPQITANWYRLTVCAPILVAMLAYSFLPHARKYWEGVMSTLVLAIAASMFWVLLSIDAQGGPGLNSWVGVLNFSILELYCFVILGVRFNHALPSGLVVLGMYEYAMCLRFDGDVGRTAYLSYHTVTMTIICGMIGWWREYLLRMNFAAEFAVNQAAETHENERSLLEATLEASNSGILAVANDGRVTSTNQRLSRMWQIPADLLALGDNKALLRFAMSKLKEPEHLLKKAKQLQNKPEAISRDNIVLSDGRVFSSYSHPQRLRGDIVGRVWSFLDITDHVRAEERILQLTNTVTNELQQSENDRRQLQALLQAIPEMVWMKSESGVFLLCNNAFANLMGKSVSDVIGKMDRDFTTEEAAEKYLAYDRAAAESPTPIVYEDWGNNRVEHRRVLLETTKVAVRDKLGRLIGVLGVARDVTVIRALMSDLKAAKEAAQHSNEAKSLFLANMSHEVRTPMNAIIGMADLALNTDLNARQRNYIQKIKLASDGLLHIINDILDFSKIEAGKLQMESILFELDSVFEGLSGLVALRAESQGIELAYNVAADIPALLIGDSLRLSQILTNLVSNALKFSSGGNVTVSVKSETLQEELVELHFSVSDQGIGMTAEQMEQIFQPFVQADASTTRRFGGTGLGLAICHHLVGLLGGRIWVESELGAGSTFHFTARFQKGMDRRQLGVRSFTAQLAQHADRPVMVIDDNPLARQVLCNLLQQLGLEVVAVDNAETAMTLVQQPDAPNFLAFLVDWFMPETDGIETVKRLRAHWTERSQEPPPMILVTAHSQDEALRRVLHHVDGLLAKPVSARNLHEELARCLGLEGYIRQRNSPRAADGLFWPQFHPLDILLVEDMEINREVIGELLSGAGLNLRYAVNGLEAINEVKRLRPDLILMDCQMPVMNGFTATRLLRADPASASIPIIALTASATVEDKRRCLACGMNGYVTKPVHLEDLYAQMVQCMPQADQGHGQPTFAGNHVRPPASTGDLPAFPGIDVALGLAHVGGKKPLFLRVLKKFRDNLGQDFENQFTEAILEGNWQSADRLIHSLKGICRTLGASDLADKALHLEIAVGSRDLQEITPALARTSQQLKRVCNGLVHLEEQMEVFGVKAPTESVQPLALNQLEQLGKMLAEKDADAVDLATDLGKLMEVSPYQSAWAPISASIDRYEFSSADTGLQKLLQTIRASQS